MGSKSRFFAMGWLPDYPDFRDYTRQTDQILKLTSAVGLERKAPQSLPSLVDLRKWFSPVEDQGQIGSCTANAGAGVVEYFENRAFGRYLHASRLFLYKATRNFAQLKGDSGAFLRSTMGALVLFGAPPEEYWPYTDKSPDFDMEPSAFCYSFAANYKSIKYFRHDPNNFTQEEVLASVKQSLAGGIPSMFGFTVYNSISQAAESGKIPFPCNNERILGGHAIVAAGYNDDLTIENATCGDKTKGALLIRNSWGEGWGEKGYGWLPYDYVLKEVAMDFWSILQQNWADTGQFQSKCRNPNVGLRTRNQEETSTPS